MDHTTSTSRRLDLDWLRIGAFGLLILYHVGMYYVSWGWHIKSPHASEALEPLMLAVNPWRLSLLFLVSGCATAFMLGGTKGERPGRLALSRSRFLLLPLVFGMAVVVPPQSWLEVREKLGYTGDYLPFWARYLGGDHSFCPQGKCIAMPTWNHLWFVVYLWAYTMLALLAWRWLPGAVRRLGRLATAALRGWGLVVWPWLLLALARVLLASRFPSTHALVNDFYNHAVFLLVFCIGVLLARDAQAWAWLVAQRRLTLGLAAASYCGLMAYAFSHDAQHPPGEGMRALGRATYAALQWLAIVTLLGWAQRLLAAVRDNEARRYFTDAVFCYYIVHQTAIVLLADAMRPLQWQPALEAPVIIIGTLAACAASYEVVRRVGWLRPLFGVRRAADRLPAQPQQAKRAQ